MEDPVREALKADIKAWTLGLSIIVSHWAWQSWPLF